MLRFSGTAVIETHNMGGGAPRSAMVFQYAFPLGCPLRGKYCIGIHFGHRKVHRNETGTLRYLVVERTSRRAADSAERWVRSLDVVESTAQKCLPTARGSS